MPVDRDFLFTISLSNLLFEIVAYSGRAFAFELRGPLRTLTFMSLVSKLGTDGSI